jgi:hypothetical protein
MVSRRSAACLTPPWPGMPVRSLTAFRPPPRQAAPPGGGDQAALPSIQVSVILVRSANAGRSCRQVRAKRNTGEGRVYRLEGPLP